MSAPDTNIEKQKDNHKPSLIGIRAAMVWGALMMLVIVFYAVINGQAPTEETMTGEAEAHQMAEETNKFDTYAPGTNQSN